MSNLHPGRGFATTKLHIANGKFALDPQIIVFGFHEVGVISDTEDEQRLEIISYRRFYSFVNWMKTYQSLSSTNSCYLSLKIAPGSMDDEKEKHKLPQ